jgi:hypothetical protein
VRSGGLSAETFEFVVLVAREVALESEPPSWVVVGALPGQDVGGHPVQEPSIVRGGQHLVQRNQVGAYAGQHREDATYDEIAQVTAASIQPVRCRLASKGFINHLRDHQTMTPALCGAGPDQGE